MDLIDEDHVCRLLDEINEAIDTELQREVTVDEMEDDIYGNVNPDTLPKSFKG
ncbi:MAG: hypothetical protein AEth_00031 [Candidatus Argoarchaeum ethanivorans]|uniref:Uncharacterized protein n=1 Tax=Candidatus Argoarchaeum ethanivorans TaxID=2608793 RepID=A0A8B3SAZ5_9EURY|nr:MAG: hypothetical protein AEth_00031 [Candidatus Argoarchaeum ethanivorans]